MFEKYIMIKDNKIIVGQNATTGAWICKELPSDLKELDDMISEVSKILNKHNSRIKKKDEEMK
jgi:hypothetical protein